MFTRRELFGGAVGAGLTGGTEAVQVDRQEFLKLVDVLEDIRNELRAQRDTCSTGVCVEVETLRTRQREFLRSNNKFPDFIEVGLDVWDRLHDWHVRNRLPVNIVRLQDGRYAMPFGLSHLVLRPEAVASFVGYGFDGK
jgi:hypothetical protein